MLVVVFAAMLLAAAPDVPPAVGPYVMSTPEWTQKPDGRDVERVFPRVANRKGHSGAAIISCGVSAEGLLVDCSVEDEAPGGEGFGEAALKLADQFKMRPLTRDGQPVAGGWVRIPLRFRHPNPR